MAKIVLKSINLFFFPFCEYEIREEFCSRMFNFDTNVYLFQNS